MARHTKQDSKYKKPAVVNGSCVNGYCQYCR